MLRSSVGTCNVSVELPAQGTAGAMYLSLEYSTMRFRIDHGSLNTLWRYVLGGYCMRDGRQLRER